MNDKIFQGNNRYFVCCNDSIKDEQGGGLICVCLLIYKMCAVTGIKPYPINTVTVDPSIYS